MFEVVDVFFTFLRTIVRMRDNGVGVHDTVCQENEYQGYELLPPHGWQI